MVVCILTTKIKSFTTKFTTKKQRKQGDSFERLGNNKSVNASYSKGLSIIVGWFGTGWDGRMVEVAGIESAPPYCL